MLGRLATVNDGDGEFFSCSHSANPTRLGQRIAVAHRGDVAPLALGLSLRLAGAPQQLVDDLLWGRALVADLHHCIRDGHLHPGLARQRLDGTAADHALGDLPLCGFGSCLETRALAEALAEAAVAR